MSPFRALTVTAVSLMARLARALIDPAYEDDNPWVAKGRTMFAEAGGALSDPAISREIGNLLGNDLGQMRVQFNFKTYLVEPLYRDDNLFLWDMGDAGQQQSDDQEAIHQAVNLTVGEGGESTEMEQERANGQASETEGVQLEAPEPDEQAAIRRSAGAALSLRRVGLRDRHGSAGLVHAAGETCTQR